IENSLPRRHATVGFGLVPLLRGGPHTGLLSLVPWGTIFGKYWNRAVPISMSDAVVRLTNVTKNYQVGAERVRAVRGITFSIPAQRFTMIVGPSGSGKTTLLNLIGCIDAPSSGEVEISGRNVGHLSDKEVSDFRAAKVGFIFQSFSLIPVLSAY